MITEFIKPKTIAEALHEKQANPEAVFMAGGSWINSSRSGMKPETVISLAGLHLNAIQTDATHLIVGSTATLQDIIDFEKTPTVLKDCLYDFKNRNIRNQGTLGGAVAAKNPAFTVLPLLIAMGTTLDLASNKPATVENYTGGLILSLRVPLDVKAAFAKYSATARGVSLLSVAVGKKAVLAQDGGKIDVLPINASMTAEQISEKITSFDDYRASAKFKKYLAGQLFTDCFKAAGE